MEVVAMMALLSVVSLLPELCCWYSQHPKDHDPFLVLHVRTSWLLESLASPTFHLWICLYCTA